MCGDPFEWVVAGSCSARAALTVEPDRAVGFGGAAILSIPIDELLPVDGDPPRVRKCNDAAACVALAVSTRRRRRAAGSALVALLQQLEQLLHAALLRGRHVL